MNARALLLTPMRSTHVSLRWMVLGLFLAALCAGVAVDITVTASRGANIALAIFEGGSALLWAFFVPSYFLLAYDARQLRLPGLESTAATGVVLMLAASIAIGVLIAGHAFGTANVAGLSALTATAALAFSLLPNRLSLFIALLPAAFGPLHRVLPIPALASPGAWLWSGVTALCFGLVCIVRWRQLIRMAPEEAARGRAMVMQMRANGGARWSTPAGRADRALRQQPAWLQAETDVEGCGPAAPVRSLRVALGGWFVPQTWRGIGRQALGVLAPFAMFGTLMVLIRVGSPHAHGWRDAVLGFAYGSGITLYAGMALGLPLIGALMLRHRWSTPQRELAILGVLPGLGSPEQARRALLHAALGRSMLVGLALAGVGLVVAMALQLDTRGIAVLVSGPLLGMLANLALSLDALRSRPLRGWALGLVCSVFGSVVLSSSVTVMFNAPQLSHGSWSIPSAVWDCFGAALLVVTLMLTWLGARAGRAVLAQPHPFLAHA